MAVKGKATTKKKGCGTCKTKTAAQKPVKKTAAPKKPARKTIPSTEFTLHAPGAANVFLSGDFNDWNTTEYRARRFKDGTWSKKVKLAPGRYEYLFLVDGQWQIDPNNDIKTTNPFGSENSIIEIS